MLSHCLRGIWPCGRDFLLIKMGDEKNVNELEGKNQGQIFILDQESLGGLTGINAMHYDGTPSILELMI